MFRPVKINDSEYQEIRALAKKRGQFVQYLLTQAIRQFLATEKDKEKAH